MYTWLACVDGPPRTLSVIARTPPSSPAIHNAEYLLILNRLFSPLNAFPPDPSHKRTFSVRSKSSPGFSRGSTGPVGSRGTG